MTQPTPATETPTRDGTRYEHPAFGQISASRNTGTPGRTLYGSDFVHHAWINLRICRSQLNRDLSRDWHFDREQLISIDISEAQWATFVSSLNVGSGVPCTLDRVAGAQMPGIARRVETDSFRDETRATLNEAIQEIEAARHEVEASTLPATRRRTIAARLVKAAQHLAQNLPFVTSSFDEHMEKKVDKAKVEVNAYVTSHIMRAGLTAASPLVLEHTPKKD